MLLLPVAFLALLACLSLCIVDDNQFVNVVGFAECTDCEKSGIKTSQAFSGLHVTVKCNAADGHVETSQAAELNEEGKFTVSIPQKLAKQSEECYAKLHSASLTQCSKLLINSNKGSSQDISITGKLKFSKETCESKFLWKHPLPHLPKLQPHPWKKSLPPLHPITQPPLHLPPIPVAKKPCPPLFKPPTPAYIPPFVKPPPVPVFKPTPTPAPVPVYKPPPVPVYKPTPTPVPVPVYKPPPVPVYKPKPTPTPVPIYTPPPVPVYKPKPTPTPVPVYKPPPVPAYKPAPIPKIKKPRKPFVIVKPRPIPIYKPHPLPPLIPKIKEPFPPFPKIDPHKFFHHHKYGKIIPKIPHKLLKHPKLIGKLPHFPINPHD